MRRTGDTRNRLLARQISDMDEGVVERRIDMRNTEDELALSNLGTERNGGVFLRGLGLLRRLQVHPKVSSSIQPDFDHQTAPYDMYVSRLSIKTIHVPF